MAMRPASVMTMATTNASRGRSMKMLENIRSGSGYDRRRHDLAGTHLLYPLDDDQFPFLQAVGDDDIPTLLHPERYAALPDLLRRIDQQNIAAGLVEQDGGLRNRQRRSRRTAFQRDADDSTGDQKTVRVGNCGSHRHGIGRGVDLDVEEVAQARMRIDAAVGQVGVNGLMRVFVRFGDPALVVEDVALADLEDDIDGILADDGRQPSGRRLDQVA